MSNDQTNVESYEFEPIKGYPMLNWKGKRPFRSTQYFPAQLKEVYGQEDDGGWINKIFWGDNLQVMSHLLKEFRGKVDLIYIDPPFDSKADYKKSIKLKGKSITNDTNSFEEKQYTDIWSNDEFLQFIYERVILLKELLSSNGTIVIHCDWHKSHHVRLIMDEVFGSNNFQSEVIWRRSSSTGSSKALSNKYPSNHDTLFVYTKSDVYTYNRQYKPYEEKYLKRFSHNDNDGRGVYRLSDLNTFSEETFQRLKADNRLVASKKEGGNWSYKRYLTETKGVVVDDVWCEEDDNVWLDINFVNPMAKEGQSYPTQKPEALLTRIIKTLSNPGDLVFDCFMGSGTTQSVAHQLERRYIGADINLGSVQTSCKRLASLGANFEALTVNNYDVFRNPVEAKELLIEALEIQALGSNTIYDGEKDGFKVKIMPVNRIATKEDLNDLIQGFPYKQFEERKEANPNKPVEEIILVCMGHEPGLGAELERESHHKLNVQVVDILRDKSDLTFKYDSEASIEIKDGKLIIEAFYPRNLLQKLSQQKDDVTEWREMVETIMIDWNFDGAVMEPIVIDIPAKDAFVAGEYEIPEGANNIKIKITDLLSESYEEVIAHG